MQRRTFESPMDWEYQGTGPVDATSPFTQLARNPSQSSMIPEASCFCAAHQLTTRAVFSSPSKSQSQHPFSNPPPLSTPTKQQAPPAPSSFFTPRIPGSQTAAPFRNPAFTTPRKPFDDLALSEASGAETSPALTEPSDCPNDTPELDRMADLNMATITPSRVNKGLRYGKNGLGRRHAPGRGEIPRPNKEHSGIDYVRKRKRRNQDRDIASTRNRDYGSASDSDDSGADGQFRRPWSRRGKQAGLLGAMTRDPDFAANMHKMIQVSLHAVVACSFVWLGWKGYNAVHADISTANRAAQAARLNDIAECTKQYQENQCVQNLPALRDLCEQWKNCMTDDPEAIFMVRNTIKEIASIMNEFSGGMHLKSWVRNQHIALIGPQANIRSGVLHPRRPSAHHRQQHDNPKDREQQAGGPPDGAAVPQRRSVMGPRAERLQPLDARPDAALAPAPHRDGRGVRDGDGRRRLGV